MIGEYRYDLHHLDTSIIPLCIHDSETLYKGMQNTTPFSSDPNPDLTQTIRDVVNEGHTAPKKDVQEGIVGRVVKKIKRAWQTSGTGGDKEAPNERWWGAHWDRKSGTRRDDIHRAHMKRKARQEVRASPESTHESFNTNAEYTKLLESVLLALCEELELDPNELVEAMRLTPARSAVLDRVKTAARPIASQGSGMAQHNAVARMGRVDSLRGAAAGGGDDKGNRRSQQALDRETRPSSSRGKSYQQKYSHGS